MSDAVPTALRSLVRARAKNRCEYCLLHEEDSDLAHEPDHVIASKHRGRTREENLAWSCFECNRHKGSDVGSFDVESTSFVRLFNPRMDEWSNHFRLEGPYIVPLTPEARVTEFLLQLNDPDRVDTRGFLMAAGRYPR